jgi:hypothetical protein
MSHFPSGFPNVRPPSQPNRHTPALPTLCRIEKKEFVIKKEEKTRKTPLFVMHFVSGKKKAARCLLCCVPFILQVVMSVTMG